MSKYERRLKSTAFMITVNTNKTPYAFGYRSSIDSPDPLRFREDIAARLEVMFDAYARDHLDFWQVYKRKNGNVNSTYHWGNVTGTGSVVSGTSERLLEHVDIYIALEVGKKYHRLHAHIMVDVKHRGKLKVNVATICNQLRRVRHVATARVSSIINLFTGDRRVNIFNYVNKDTKEIALESKPDEFSTRDYYSGDKRQQWVKYEKEADDRRGTHGLRLVFLNRDVSDLVVTDDKEVDRIMSYMDFDRPVFYEETFTNRYLF